MKKVLIIIITIITFTSCSYLSKQEVKNIFNVIEKEEKEIETIKVEEPPEPIVREATIAAVGDIMVHEWQLERAYNSTSDEFDFTNSFKYIKSYLEDADYTIGNLETTLAGKDATVKIGDMYYFKGYTGYPCFNTPQILADNINDAGIDMVSTANNHSLDSHPQGVIDTIHTINDAGLEHVGTYETNEDEQKNFIKEINGITFGFTSYTYGTNGFKVPDETPFLVHTLNMYDEEKIQEMLNKVQQISNENVDFNVVIIHFGDEYHNEPSEYQKDIVNRLFDAGADIILGSHPHVLQPIEIRDINRNGVNRKGIVIYSLGNFLSSQRYTNSRPKNTDIGTILKLKLEKTDDNTPIIKSLALIPTFVYWNEKEISTIPVIEAYEAGKDYKTYLDDKERQRIEYSYNETINHLIGDTAITGNIENNQYNINITNQPTN